MILCMAIIAGLGAGCNRKERTAEEQIRSQEERVGLSASIAADFHVGADKECKIAGIENIEDCSKNTGTLLQEKSAKALAIASLANSKHYFDSCMKEFSAEYCNQLIARAIQIEWRKPVSSDSVDTRVDERGREE
jgi:hypothetical protein